MLSIMPSLNFRYELNFFLEINQSTIELNAFVNQITQYSPFYLSLEITKKIFTICSHIGVKFFPYPVPLEKLSIS